MVAVGEGDVDGGDLEVVFEEWCGRVVRVVKGEEIGEGHNGESDGFDELEEEESDDDDDEEEVDGGEVDMEDIAGKAPAARRRNGKVEGALSNGGENGVRDMVTPIIRTSLEKQVRIIFLYILRLIHNVQFQLSFRATWNILITYVHISYEC